MIDPVMLGVVGCAVIGLMFVLAYFFSTKEEGDFEKAFNENALKLLNDTGKKEKVKAKKEKATRKKEEKPHLEKNGVKKEVRVQEEENKREEEHVEEVNHTMTPMSISEEPVIEKKTIEVKESAPKQEKKKLAKQVNVKDLDAKKVMSRLSNLSELEPEYVQFLSSYIRETDVQKSNLASEVKAVLKKFNESALKLERVTKEKNQMELKQKDEQAKIGALNAKLQEAVHKEAEARKGLLEANRGIQKSESEYSSQISSLNNKLAAQEKEVLMLKDANLKLSKEIKTASMQVPEAELKNLKSEFVIFEKVATQVKNELEAKSKMCEQLKAEVEKKDLALSTLAAEKTQWGNKENEIMEKYNSLKKLVDKMNGEIEQFVEYKKEQEEIIAGLRKVETEYEVLKKEAASKTVEIPLNSLRDAASEVEEECVLKKNTSDLAAASTSRNEEVEELKRDKERLQMKIDELRARNLAILEKVEDAEKKVGKSEEMPKKEVNIEGERKKIVETVSRIPSVPKFEKVGDEKAFGSWLEGAVSDVVKKLEDGKKEVKTQCAAEKRDKCNDTSYYQEVLKSLVNEIDRIETLAAKQAVQYEKTIKELRGTH